MAGIAFACPRCAAARHFAPDTASGAYPCPACGRVTEFFAFPALRHGAKKGHAGESLSDLAEAACYNHPEKRAAAICTACGRFVCALCEITLHGNALCPACVEGDAEKHVKSGRILQMDRLALHLSLLSYFPAYFLYPFVAPYIVYLCIRYWRTPQSVMPRRRWRFVVALALVVLEFVLIAGFIATMFMAGTE